MDLEAPLEGWFTHLAWAIDLRLTGPFVRFSQKRAEHGRELARLAAELTAEEEVSTAHALEITAIPPIDGGPRYDLALLVHADEPLSDLLVERAAALGLDQPELALTARNAVRIGDTEERGGEILLNHFAGEASSEEAVGAWTSVARWYADKLGVDNSTLLEFTGEAPFLIMNYAVIPGKVVPFLVNQLLRPSFYRTVRGQLREVGITPFPLFARRLET
ncbi:hypothetical protein [Aeromicrobium piscarium]|uniref:Uncharacterized protein n=1 Tax=Aeromicrobium piscarium TaxID=2590901 RepID=A0A554RN09_9ACTN|nr:hypothetical protein [Aeromicrobium piscarium]TSD55404.1 hypothetical protein FNM00_16880 [Aeromicrobium piscarium]